MVNRICGFALSGLVLLFAVGLVAQQSQDQQNPQQGQNPQNQGIPDAPSAVRPVPPPEPPSPRPSSDENKSGTNAAESSSQPAMNPPPREIPEESAPSMPPPPMPEVKTVPEGSVPKDKETGDDVGYTIKTTTNLVLVPVTVKDNDGRLVAGLLPKDFSVLENGQKQPLKFFTSDPFPLSAAVVIDLGMPDVGVRKVQETLSALQGSFSQYDEIAIYTYSGTVGRVSDFNTVGQRLTAVLNQVKSYSGANNGPPVTGGPLGPQGPQINGRPVEGGVPPVITPPKTAHVLNDAILSAARDLSRRDRTRRKIIFVISDGREQGSRASYSDTLKVLLTQNIIVYAVAVEGGAMPIYGSLEKIHLPKTGKLVGYGNILPKYVNATGGGTVYSEYARADIERAYSRAIGDARNQYTLGYTSKPGIGGYRRIEVRVRRPDVNVYAKDGYYPLPAQRTASQ
jgi:VWFA-related protein